MGEFETQGDSVAHEWADGPAGSAPRPARRRRRLLSGLMAAPLAIAVLGLGISGLSNAKTTSDQQTTHTSSSAKGVTTPPSTSSKSQVAPTITGAPLDDEDGESEDND